ncbi:MAG: hypothetical protein CMK83_21770 [Pseudomonadales bacterium]|jgi:hypothetical protein|uniref:hypothetical protein n=1 Tax=unclassified Ketobacter TaxID=2639109 RepID=UPI000C8D514F|nr:MULTISPECIES: hypothetical protein [unclassified Ketobacter]MAA59408.1 hypothetical protein [Pseudomonadales bacterium]MEC8810160.1 hypothetical protein [Pseudomonadota bacterium]TNC89993.1 MAG: hypothetical protein CSH49_04885 [Alcanivorax sp.]HAG95121.1 hypothetical protein [Gammaproteobacteria bacterium]MAQ26843.1 hypothetical protein [Pseudomonadales bacterium]|tara:strand:+ start:1404 stop:1922 length:519 start_codon:yes stop_codon:yes gene_type:complete
MKLVRSVGVALAALVCVVFADDAVQATKDVFATQIAESASALDGLWVSNCYKFEEGRYQVRTFEFVLDHLATITTISYPDTHCAESPLGSAVISATWDMGETLVTEEGLLAYRLDVLLKAGPRQELTTVKQIVHFQRDSFILGINRLLSRYPDSLDWEIIYSRIPSPPPIDL